MFDDRAEINQFIRKALGFIESGQDDNVILEVEGAFSLDPTCPEAIHVLGLLAVKLNELIRAKDLFTKATEIAPDKYEHTEALAIINAKLGLLSESLFYGKLAAALQPYPHIQGFLPEWLGSFEENFMSIQEKPHFRYGKYHYDHGNYQLAIDYLQKAAAVDSKDADAWRLLSKALRISDRSYESLLMLKSLDEIGLNDPADLSEVALVMADMGLFKESLSCHQEVLSYSANNYQFFSNYIFSLNKSGLLEETKQAERDWGSLFLEPIFEFDYDVILDSTNDHLNIGLVSGRFRSKDGLDHIFPLIINHDKSKVHINCYSYNNLDDIISRKIAGSVDTWTDLSKIDDKTAATIIYNDGNDILIDLDANLEISHPKVFAYNPAPVILKYLGCSETAKNMGYSGIIGSDNCYPQVSREGAIVSGAIAAFSPEIKPNNLKPSILGNIDNPKIGIAPTGAELSDAFYDGVKLIVAAIPHAKIILNTRHIGGGGIIEGIENELERYGVRENVHFSILDNDRYAALSDFVAQCDLLVVFSHMRSIDIAWEFLNEVKPVLSTIGELPHLRETTDILRMLDMDGWCFNSTEDLLAELTALTQNKDNYFLNSTKNLYTNIVKCIDEEFVKMQATNFIDAIRKYQEIYVTSKTIKTNGGGS